MAAERFQIRQRVEAGEWDTLVRSLGGNIAHSSVFADYVIAAEANAVPCFVSLDGGEGGPAGLALAFQARSPRRLLGPLTGRVWLAALPAVSTNLENGLLDFLTNVEQYARSSGNAILEVHSAASHGGREELTRLGFQLTRRLEFELNLQRSEDEMWNAMEYKRRKNIKKAKRLGVTVHDLPGEQGIAELRRLQGDSSKRIVARGGPDITRNRSLAEDPVGVLLDGGVGRIVVAELEGQIVSASLFTFFNGLVYHTLSGHSNEGTNAQAPTMLLWETIKRYRREGAERFNFGGCSASAVEKGSPEHGVYDYKKAFGGECLECTSGRKVLHRVRYGLFRALKRVSGR